MRYWFFWISFVDIFMLWVVVGSYNVCFSLPIWGNVKLNYFKYHSLDPGWCGSVDWASACEPKGHQFNSQSGHMPGLQVRCPVGGMWEATTHCCFSPFLSPSLSLNLKAKQTNKQIPCIRNITCKANFGIWGG